MSKEGIQFGPLANLSGSWRWIQLEDLVLDPKQDIVDGPFGSNLKASEYMREGIPIARLQNIDRNKFIDKNIKFVSSEKANYLNRHNFQPADILITKLGDPLGKACIAPDSIRHGIIVADIVRVRLQNDSIDKRYLTYAINSPFIAKEFERHTKGTTRPRVNLDIIRKLRIPVAPRDLQEQIVAEIEKQYSRLDEAVVSLNRAKANLKRYKAAVLKAAVEGKLTEQWRRDHPGVEPAEKLLERILSERQKKWEESELAKIKEKGAEPKDCRWKEKYKEPNPPDYETLPPIPRGWHWASTDQLFWFVTSGSRGWAKYYSNAGPLFLRVGNLDHDSITLDMKDLQRVTPQKGAEGVRTRVEPNDILISITADVGMVGVIPDKFEEAYINQHISLARPVNCINPSYMAWYLASRYGQKQFQHLQRGATKAGLGLDDIRSVNIPLPPAEEQKEIISQIEQRLSIVNEIDGEVNKNLNRADRLRQSILKKAFSGKLVPRDLFDGSSDA